MTGWVEHVLWWHIYPLGFVGAAHVPGSAEVEPENRLGHIEAWLDHAIELAC